MDLKKIFYNINSHCRNSNKTETDVEVKKESLIVMKEVELMLLEHFKERGGNVNNSNPNINVRYKQSLAAQGLRRRWWGSREAGWRGRSREEEEEPSNFKQ